MLKGLSSVSTKEKRQQTYIGKIQISKGAYLTLKKRAQDEVYKKQLIRRFFPEKVNKHFL